jgi:hypothetical protein
MYPASVRMLCALQASSILRYSVILFCRFLSSGKIVRIEYETNRGVRTFLQAEKAPRVKTGCRAMNHVLARSSGRELGQELFEGLFSRSVSGLNGFIKDR